MSKHSPGPWQACTASNGRCKCSVVWSIPRDMPVATAHGPDTEGEGTTPEDERVANVRLIAAAPRMLELLRESLCWLEDPSAYVQDSCDFDERVHALLALLAEIDGET